MLFLGAVKWILDNICMLATVLHTSNINILCNNNSSLQCRVFERSALHYCFRLRWFVRLRFNCQEKGISSKSGRQLLGLSIHVPAQGGYVRLNPEQFNRQLETCHVAHRSSLIASIFAIVRMSDALSGHQCAVPADVNMNRANACIWCRCGRYKINVCHQWKLTKNSPILLAPYRTTVLSGKKNTCFMTLENQIQELLRSLAGREGKRRSTVNVRQ